MFCSFLGLLNLVKQSSVLILLKGFGSSRGENSFGTWNKNKKESSKHEVGGKTPSRPALTSGAYKLRLPRIDSILMFLLPSIRIADLGCEMFGIGLIFTEMLQREDLTVCVSFEDVIYLILLWLLRPQRLPSLWFLLRSEMHFDDI